MPFGNGPVRLGYVVGALPFAIAAVANAFRQRACSAREAMRRTQWNGSGRQCLSATGLFGSSESAFGSLRIASRSPMPFGNGPVRLFDTGAHCKSLGTVANAFRQRACSAQKLGDDIFSESGTLSPMPFGNGPVRLTSEQEQLK